MKILYIDQTGQLGGGELAILPWLCAHPKDAQVLLLEDGPFRSLIEQCGIPVHIKSLDALKNIRRESRMAAIVASLPAFLSLRSQIRKLANEFDLLYANSQKAFLLAALSKRRGQPIIWHLRDILTAEHFSPILRKVAVFVGNRYASVIITNSRATADSFIAAGGKGTKVRIVHDGIGAEPFDNVQPHTVNALREELGTGSSPTVGVFGRLSPWKGQSVLLEALSDLPGVHAVLVGDALFGEAQIVQTLKERANQPDINGRVHFLGFRRDIPALMKTMDIIVHTSTSPEPFGMVIVEGMLAQKPVIATRAGGAVEIIRDGETGLLVAPSSVLELKKAIKGLLADPDTVRRLELAGYRSAKNEFSLEAMFAGIAAVIAEFAPPD